MIRGRAFTSRSTLLIGAITLLSVGNMVGRYWPGDITAVSAVVMIVLSAVLAFVSRWAHPGPAPHSVWAGAVAMCMASLLHEPLGNAEATAAVVCGAAALYLPLRAAGVLLAAIATMIVSTTAPHLTVGYATIDVFTMIQGAAGTLLHGADPYRPAFATVDFSTTPVSLSRQSMVYGPGVILLSLPGRVLGDVRFAGAAMWLVIVAACATLSRRAGRPGGIRDMLALLIALPIVPSMIVNAWADVYGLAMLAAWLALRGEHRRIAVPCLGLCLAAKPTLGAVLLVFMVWSRAARRDLAPATMVALTVVAPFAVWDGFNFWQSTLGTLFNRAVYVNRTDAVCINTVVHLLRGGWLPGPLLLLMTTALAVPIIAIRPRDRSDMLALGGALTTVILVTGRLAFLNYYFVAAVALLLALAVEGGAGDVNDIALPGTVGRRLMAPS